MSSKPVKLNGEDGEALYDVFVHFMHAQFGGPKTQRTPTTDSAERIASHMQGDGEQLCYELCREYISNYAIDAAKEVRGESKKAIKLHAFTCKSCGCHVVDWHADVWTCSRCKAVVKDERLNKEVR